MKLVRLTCSRCRVAHDYDRRVLLTKRGKCPCGTPIGESVERYVSQELAEMRGVSDDFIKRAQEMARAVAELIEADEKPEAVRIWN